jgi:hypothetical protein
MPRKVAFPTLAIAAAALLCVAATAAPLAAQVCGPDPDGRIATPDYRETVIFWEPVVEYERIVLTISGPCEDIVREFPRGEQIFFDLREIERVQDGSYTWEIRREATIDPATKKALAAARAKDDDSIWWSLFQKGAIPAGPYADRESFQVIRGVIVPPGGKEEGEQSAVQATGGRPGAAAGPRQAGVFASLARPQRTDAPLHNVTAADQVIPDDLIVQGSLCVGFDCVNNENFSFDTIRMKENNLRIKFDDTSTLAGFPNTDWQLTANDSASGGAGKFSIEDISGARVPFTVRAGAPTDSLFIGSTGRVGLRTATPVLDLHINTSNTPGIRLEQNNSGGFTAQTWDIAGNEANFFVRDVTGGSQLSFRIRPGAPTSSIDINADGEVGIGTASPTQELTVKSDTANENVVEILSANANNHVISRIFETTDGSGLLSLFNGSSVEQFRFTGSGGHNFISGTLGINCNAAGGFDFAVKNGTSSTTACNTGTFSGLTAGSTQFTVVSSRTMKENLEPVAMPDILEKIAAVDVYTYDLINGPKDVLGLVAEDFHGVFGRGSDKAINGQEVEMALWLAVKELSARNQELAERLAELEARLAGGDSQ